MDPTQILRAYDISTNNVTLTTNSVPSILNKQALKGWVGSDPAASLRTASGRSGSLREPSEPTRQTGFRQIWLLAARPNRLA